MATAPAKQPDNILSLQPGHAIRIRMEAGHHYKVRRALRADDPDALEVPDNLIASRQGDALHLRYADGSTLTLDDFYRTCTSDAVCSVNLVSDSEAGITLHGGNAAGGTVSGDGGTLVYAHGKHDVLLSMAQGQSSMAGTFTALGDAPVLTYLPQTPYASAAYEVPAHLGFTSIPAVIGGSILMGAGFGGAGGGAGRALPWAGSAACAEGLFRHAVC